MKEEPRHPTFALDLYWAEQARDPDLEAHVASCDRCRAYLAHLDAADARPFALPFDHSTPWRRRGFVAAFAFALALVVCVVVWRRDSPARLQPTYVATKGAPAVQVLLRREGNLRVWNGPEAIRARDMLALRVACEAMARVTVFVRDRDRWMQTFDGACVDEILPFTLVVDAQPGDERIAVVFSQSARDQAAVSRAVDLQTRSADLWALQFVFSKETQK